MADPYRRFTYDPNAERSDERRYAPNTDVQEQIIRANAQRYDTNTRLLIDSQKQLGKYDLDFMKMRLQAKKDQLKAINDANNTLRKALDDLRTASVDTYEARAAAAKTAYAASVAAQVKLVQAQYAFPPTMTAPFLRNAKINADAAIEALSGSSDELMRTGSKFMLPGLVNFLLSSLFKEDGGKWNINTDRDTLVTELHRIGVKEEVIDSLLEYRDMALEVHQSALAADDSASRSLAVVNGIIGQGAKTQEDIQKRVAELEPVFNNGLAAVSTALNISPTDLQASIDVENMAMEERDTLAKHVADLWAAREADGMTDDGEGDRDGRILADDNFRLWAADNGYEDIGYPRYDDNGKVIGASKGRQFDMALYEYNWQMRHAGKWNDAIGFGLGGSTTDQVVEVSYVPPEAPEVASTSEGNFVRMGGKSWRMDESGKLVVAEAPADAAWNLMFKRNEDGSLARVSAADLFSADANLQESGILTPSNDTEAEQARELYAVKVVGEREKQQAAFIQRYGRDGYLAVIDENGERHEIDGSLKPRAVVLSGGYQAAGVESAMRKGLRQAARGRISTAGAAKAEGAPAYQFGGVTIIEGEPSSDPTVERLRTRIAEKKAEPIKPTVIEPIVSSRESRKKERLSQRFRPLPAGSAMPEEVVRPPDDEGMAPATAPATPTRVEGVSYEGMADDYKRSTLYPRSPDTPKEPTAEEPPFVVPPEVQTPEPDDNRRAKREALRRRYYGRQQ